MEIIHLVLGKANPDRMNGVNKVVYQLATQQANFGKKVSVWGIAKDTEHNYGVRNFETLLFPSSKFPFGVHKDLKKAIVSKKGKAVFHLHGGWIPVFFSVSKILEKHQIPFVITPHGAYNTIAMHKNGLVKKYYFDFFEKKVLSRAAKIHAIGESEITGLSSIYPNQKSVLLPYGFENQVFNTKINKVDNNYDICFVGRIDIHTKGLDLLIEAFSKFSKSVSNARLRIIGDGEQLPMLKKLVSEKNIPNVVFEGSKFGAEKNRLIELMDCFAHPSRNEGLPTSVLEALSLGVPCIVTHATNVGEYISRYKVGACVPNENVNALVDAFQKLYDQKQRDELQNVAVQAQHLLHNEFSWKKLIPQFDKLYLSFE